MTDQSPPRAATDPASHSPAGIALSQLTVQILRLATHLNAIGDALAQPAGHTSARWQVLAAADHAPSTVAEIARELGLARQSVQRVADVLAGEAFITYEDNPNHQRAKLVHLTASGRRSLRQIQAAQIAWANALGARLSERDMVNASKVLDALQSSLQSLLHPA
jgi:DNA-binding MarR family transcriptional regulator